MSFDLGDYNDVASRMREFFERYPSGRLRPDEPWRVETVGDKTFIVYSAAAYRDADDVNPGVGTAWEPFPGKTRYTQDSELQNAETSAWGRAILAVGAADTKKGIASREEVRNRQADRDTGWDSAQPVARPTPEQSELYDEYCKRIAAAETEDGLPAIWEQAKADFTAGKLVDEHGDLLRQAIGDRRRELSGAPI